MAGQIAIAAADLFDLMMVFPIAQALGLGKDERRLLVWNPFARWEDASLTAELGNMGVAMPTGEGEKPSSEAKAALKKAKEKLKADKHKFDFKWVPREKVVAGIKERYL